MAGLRAHGKPSKTLNKLMGQMAPRPAAQTEAEAAAAQGTTQRLMDAMKAKKAAFQMPSSRTVDGPPIAATGEKQFDGLPLQREDERMAP